MPVYGTPLTLAIAKHRLAEHGAARAGRPARLRAGRSPRDRRLHGRADPRDHSIADGIGLAIETPLGTVVHTGDFKLDAHPIDRQQPDYSRFAALGERGVLVLCSDSTNVGAPGRTPARRRRWARRSAAASRRRRAHHRRHVRLAHPPHPAGARPGRAVPPPRGAARQEHDGQRGGRRGAGLSHGARGPHPAARGAGRAAGPAPGDRVHRQPGRAQLGDLADRGGRSQVRPGGRWATW